MLFLRFSSLLFILIVSLGICASAAENSPGKIDYAIAIHGGAISRLEKMSAVEEEQYRKSLGKALEVGRKILSDGGDALDAVEQTIRAMEDDPTFNAGKGAVFNSVGKHELDASIMDGRNKRAGAVAAVTTVKNPISLARLVMTKTRHVLLAGEGAEQFADALRGDPKIERVPNSYFDTEARKKKWLREREKTSSVGNALCGVLQAAENDRIPFVLRNATEVRNATEGVPYSADYGTVGCVALDKKGNLTAGTSTGGLSNKMWGRVGDSPIIGAGTYADNATCAVSCTGIGEYFIRNSAAFHIAALMAYRGLSIDQATREVVQKVLPPDTGGVIALDRRGRISFRFNTAGMARAAADSTGRIVVELK